MLGFSFNKFTPNDYVHIRKFLILEMVCQQAAAGLKENAFSVSIQASRGTLGLLSGTLLIPPWITHNVKIPEKKKKCFLSGLSP